MTRTKAAPDSDHSCPDQLTASQWFDRVVPDFFDVPERRLLLAVLSDAVRRLQAGVKQRTEVLRWMKGHAARIPFQALCDGLRIDAGSLARRLSAPQCALPIFRRVRPQAILHMHAGRQRARRAVDPDAAGRVTNEAAILPEPVVVLAILGAQP